MQRWYQVDLRDLWRPGGGLTWRRLVVLLRWLPAEATVWQVTGRAWMTRSEEYLAGLWELWAEQPHPRRLGPPYDPAAAEKRPVTASQWQQRLLAQRERIQREREQRRQRREAAGG